MDGRHNRDPAKVLIVPSFFPSSTTPNLGIFMRDQLRLIGGIKGYSVKQARFEARSLRAFKCQYLKENYFQLRCHNLDGVGEYVLHGWNPAANTRVGSALSIHITKWLLKKVAGIENPTIIHAQNAIHAGAAAVHCRNSPLTKVIITEHSSGLLAKYKPAWMQRLLCNTYGGVDLVICVSRFLADAVKRINGAACTVILPNPIDTEFFQINKSKTTSPVTFAVVCNLVPIKRVDLAIAAFQRFLALSNSPSRLLIVGGGPEMQRLQALAGQFAGQNIEFLGAADREMVRNVISKAHYLIITSEVETFGMVGAEALAAGVPVISTRCGGPEEYISNKVGILLDSIAADDMAAAMINIQKMQFDPYELRAIIEKRFGWDVIRAKARMIYESILN